MIESSDILQMDATIIVGILILLTITSYKLSNPEIPKSKKLYFTPVKATAFVIIPFSVSAIIELLKNTANPIANNPVMDILELALPIIGFIYIAIIITNFARFGLIAKDTDT